MEREKNNITRRRMFIDSFEQGRRLQKCLDRMGMSQAQLARKLSDKPNGHMWPQTIGYVIRGERNIPGYRIDEFASVLGVRREYLLLQDDYMTFGDMFFDKHNKGTEIYTASFNLLSALGYRFGGTPLEKAHNEPPVRYIVVTPPGGGRFQIKQEDFNRIIDDVSDYARFRMQQAKIRHR